MPLRPLEISVTVGGFEKEDGDYTQECLDAGTTFTPTVPGMEFDPVPVTSFVVKDQVATVKGIVWVDLEEAVGGYG